MKIFQVESFLLKWLIFVQNDLIFSFTNTVLCSGKKNPFTLKILLVQGNINMEVKGNVYICEYILEQFLSFRLNKTNYSVK